MHDRIQLHKHTLENMTAVWLLPVVPAIVAAATGGILASSLDTEKAAITILTSYVLWGIGVALALIIIVVYFQRLMIHNLPAADVIVSVFLPLGPFGQGSYGIIKLGQASKDVFPLVFPQIPILGEIFHGIGILVGLLLWGVGLWWGVHAVSSVTYYSLIKKHLAFQYGMVGIHLSDRCLHIRYHNTRICS